MPSRRAFLKTSAASLLAGTTGCISQTEAMSSPANTAPADPRPLWSALATRLADPVLTALAARRLKALIAPLSC